MLYSPNALDAASYLLARAAGEISNQKLSALLYYAQGFCLAMRGEPLFPEGFEAWDDGPVAPKVYCAFKEHGSNAIPAPADVDLEAYLPEDRELLDAILATYGRLSADELGELARSEVPWRLAHGPSESSHGFPIFPESIALYFGRALPQPRERGGPGDFRPRWPLESFRHQKRRSLSHRLEGRRAAIRALAASRSITFDPWGDDEAPAGPSDE